MKVFRSSDVFIVQEHWYACHNLDKFSNNVPGCFCFDSSAMDFAELKDILIRRYLSGVMTLIKKIIDIFLKR